MNLFLENLQVPLFLPIWVAAIIFIGRFLNIKMSKFLIFSISGLTVFIGLLLFSFGTKYLCGLKSYADEVTFNFLNVGNMRFELGYYLDFNSLLMAMLVSLVCLLTQLYACRCKDKSYPRLFAYLNICYFSFLGFVLSPNLFQSVIFSFLITMSLYLLVGFHYKKESVSALAQNIIFVGVTSDILLCTAFIIISSLLVNYTYQNSFCSLSFISLPDIANYLYSFTNDVSFTIICILLVFGIAFKVLTLPVLSSAISDEEEKSISVLSLIYVSLACINSINLIGRLFDLYAQSNFVLKLIIYFTGAISFLFLYFSFAKTPVFISDLISFFKNKIFKNLCSAAAFIDKYIIDGMLSLNIYIARSFSWIFSRMQTGNIQTHVAYGIFIIALIFALLIFAYAIILQYGLYGG